MDFILEDADAPSPPPLLYKYLSADRITNVLRDGTVRFSRLISTNDSFEVRTTFRKIAGPRFVTMLSEAMKEVLTDAYVEKLIEEQLTDMGLGWLPSKAAMDLLDAQSGGRFMDQMKVQIEQAMGFLVSGINRQDSAERFIERMGAQLLCFSLSERPDSSPMWAHYAGNESGFVLAFRTDHPWFSYKADGSTRKLQKVQYFDGYVEEPLADVRSALISKTTDWAYEKEWRIYIKDDEIEKTVGDPSDPVELLTFPSASVQRIIVGRRTPPEIIEEIVLIAKDRFPDVSVTCAQPNKHTHTYVEVPLWLPAS